MSAENEWVSIICLSHNQASFIADAVASAELQTHSKIEIILVDDGSEDGSKEVMRAISRERGYRFIDIKKSIGNCAAFNRALKLSIGRFIIDLAADDLLEPQRVSLGLQAFSESSIGVNFCDVCFIDEHGTPGGTHFKRDEKGKLEELVPAGDVYSVLIQKYFISPPSMMIRRTVLEELGGYDESLPFEDFDFWIRSSRDWNYSFTNEILVKKRILKKSLSSRQTQFRNKHQKAVLTVCHKIKALNRTPAEQVALRKRVYYEIRQCLRYGNLELIPPFASLLF